MRTRKMRLVSALLAVAMIFVMLPVGAFAAGDQTEYEVTVTTADTGDARKSSVQKALERLYPNVVLSNVKKLTVTTDGVELSKDDFQFMSGVVVDYSNKRCSAKAVNPTNNNSDWKYNGESFDWLSNLSVLDLTKATCKENAIPPRAFQYNSNITKIYLPENLNRAYIHAFSTMGNLEYLGTKAGNLCFPSTMTIMGEGMLWMDSKVTGEIQFPASLEAIGGSCFRGSGVKGDVVIPGNVNIVINTDVNDQNEYEEIGSIFAGTNITSITFEGGTGTVKIGGSFVENCPDLKRVTILEGVKEIGQSAFRYGYEIGQRTLNQTTLVIPKSVTKIAASAFSNMGSNLESIIVKNADVELSSAAFVYLNSKIYFAKERVNADAYWSDTATILNTNGGTIETDKNGDVLAKKDSATGLYIPTKETEKFDGWYNGDTKLTSPEQVVAGNTTPYTAHWIPKEKYTVTFDLNGHGDNTTKTVYEDDTVTKPTAPAAKGYKFAGWYADAECTTAFDFTKPITANTTVYAKWEAIPDHQLTVTGGTFTVKDETVETKTEGDKLIANVPEGAEVTVTFNKAAYADSNLVFGGWEISGLDDKENYANKEEFTFTMPETGVTIEAMPKTADTEDDSWDAATVITGVAIGAGAAVLTYHIGTELYAEQVLGKGVAVPKTREDVALKAWELAGKPAVELNGEPLSETAQAEKWAVESGLMQNDAEGNFNGAKKMNKLKALRTLAAAKKLG